MTSTPFRTLPSRQSGFATLLVALIIMVAITLAVLFTAQTSILEERMASNEARMKMTANAAHDGLDRAVAFAQQEGSNGDPLTRFEMDYEEEDGGRKTYFRTAYVNPSAADDIQTCPATPAGFDAAAAALPLPDDLNETAIWSCGWSDDTSARKGLTVTIRGFPAVADPPSNPLTTRGGVSVNGRVRVFNAFNNLSIWSGEEFDITGNPGNTYIHNPEAPNPDPSDPDNWNQDEGDVGGSCAVSAYYVCTSDKGRKGPDVMDSDLQLRDLTEEEFFRNFMGMPPSTYRETVVTELNPDPADLNGMNREVIWLDGDSDVSGTIGTQDEPVILVVDGDATVTGDVNINGIFFVRGDLRGAGNVTVRGATVVEGMTDTSGTPYFIFDPVAAGGTPPLGPSGMVSGTWRDWTNL